MILYEQKEINMLYSMIKFKKIQNEKNETAPI